MVSSLLGMKQTEAGLFVFLGRRAWRGDCCRFPSTPAKEKEVLALPSGAESGDLDPNRQGRHFPVTV